MNPSNFASFANSARWLALCGPVFFLACSAHRSDITGVVLFDEQVSLERQGIIDGARREIVIPAGATVVAFVEELGFDVTLKLNAADRVSEVENSQKGEGLEIAVIDLQDPARLQVSLTGPVQFEKPGSVHMRIESFDAASARIHRVRERLAAYRAWARATSHMSNSGVPAIGNAEISRAIDTLESGTASDPVLAAKARAVRARMFYEFEVDWRESSEEAERAADAFNAPQVADALNAARARRLQAAALQEVALSSRETEASKREADVEARRIYAELIAPGSALDAVGRGRVYNDLGLMDANAQQLNSALANFDAALVQYGIDGFVAGSKQTARSILVRAMYRGDYAAASRAYEIQIADLDSLDKDAQATLLINAAIADVNIGETDRAIARLLQAEEIARLAERESPRARALLELGFAYWSRGEDEQARTYFDRLLNSKDLLLEDAARSAALSAYGAFMRDSDQPREALKLHQAALDHANTALMRMHVHTEVSRDHAALANRDAAVAAARKALAERLAVEMHPASVEARLALAQALVMTARPSVAETEEALELANKSLREAETASDFRAEIIAHRVLARLALQKKDRAAAVNELERAIDLALAYSATSANPELQASTRASQQELFRDYLDLQMDESRTVESQERALRLLETVRMLNFDPERAGPDAERETALSSLLEQLANRHVRMIDLRNSPEPSAQSLESLRMEMATLRAQIDRLRTSKAGAGGTPDSLANASRMPWRAMSPGTVQLSFALGSTRGYLWRRSTEGAQAFILPGTAAQIRTAVLNATRIDRMQEPAAYDSAIAALSPLLLPSGLVKAGEPQVEVAADGELTYVPFAALRSPSDDRARFAQTHVLTMVSSLLEKSGGKDATSPRRWRLVAVQGATGSETGTHMRGSSTTFPALPGAAIEVAAVRARFSPPEAVQVLEGSRASIPQVRSALGEGADVMHFATHGLADVSHPLASLLSLPGELLTAGQIQEWRGNVGLVFLSACETAVGPTRFAESTPGLQRAFLRAGAENVVATLWPVEDRLAAEFAQQFYVELSAGVSAAEALARTQRAWLSSSNTNSAQKLMRRRVAAWGYVLYSR